MLSLVDLLSMKNGLDMQNLEVTAKKYCCRKLISYVWIEGQNLVTGCYMVSNNVHEKKILLKIWRL